MRTGARRNITGRLLEVASDIERIREEVAEAELPDLRSVGVGYMTNGTMRVTVGSAYVFECPKDLRHVEAIIRSLLWGLYEAQRRSSKPDDPDCRGKIAKLVDGIVNELGRGRYREPCKTCGGLTHVCVVCEVECKVPLNDRKGDHWQTKLCPDCSAWRAPREDAY